MTSARGGRRPGDVEAGGGAQGRGIAARQGGAARRRGKAARKAARKARHLMPHSLPSVRQMHATQRIRGRAGRDAAFEAASAARRAVQTVQEQVLRHVVPQD